MKEAVGEFVLLDFKDEQGEKKLVRTIEQAADEAIGKVVSVGPMVPPNSGIEVGRMVQHTKIQAFDLDQGIVAINYRHIAAIVQ